MTPHCEVRDLLETFCARDVFTLRCSMSTLFEDTALRRSDAGQIVRIFSSRRNLPGPELVR
jgi:hypothetical protein